VAEARAVVTERALDGAITLASGANGRFPTLGVSKGPHRIVVTHPGRATVVELVEAAESLEKEIVLRKCGALEVDLETPKWQREGDGTWLVEARPAERDDRARLRGVVGPRQVAVLDGAKSGSTWSLAASFIGRSGNLVVGPLRISEAVRVDEKGAVVHWKLPKLFRVSAACRDAKGVPIRDAAVSLVAVGAGTSERCEVAADEFGSAVGWVAGGTYRIEARSPTANAALRRTELVVDEDCDVDVEFARGRTLRGTVAAPDGKTLGRELVAEGGGTTRRAWSDGAGRFELPGIPPGPCQVRALGRHGESDAGSVAVAAGEGDVDDCRVVVEPGAIVGCVAGQRGERVRVTACAGDLREPLDQGRPLAVVVTWTDSEGNFRIEDVAAVTWTVLAATESEYGKGVGRMQQMGGIGQWSGVVRGVTKLQIDVAWK